MQTKITEEKKINFTKRDYFLWSAKLLLSIIVIWYLYNKVENITFAELLPEKKIHFLIAAALLGILNLTLQIFKWKYIANVVLAEKSKRKIFLSYIYGLAIGILTPARSGEVIGRKMALNEKRFFEVIGATFYDKVTNLLTTLFFGSLATILYLHFRLSINYILTVPIFLSFFFASLLLFKILTGGNAWQSIFISIFENVKYLKKFVERAKFLFAVNGKFLSTLFLFSFAIFAVYNFQFGALSSAYSSSGALYEFIWISILLFFVKSFLPVFTIGELGVREGAAIFFMSQFGYAESIGFHAAIMLFIINIAIPSFIGGLALLLREK